MVHLGDDAQVEARFGPFRDSANLDIRLEHGLHRTYNRLRCCFRRTQWNSYVTWVMWNLILVYFETVFALVPYSCMVCVERTVGSEIILDAPDGTLGGVDHLESRFFPFGDSVSVGER